MSKVWGNKARYTLIFSVALVTLVLDQVSKAFIMKIIPPGGAVIVVPGFFDLVNIRNRGAAFGFLNRQDIEWQFWLFLLAAIIAVWAILVLAKQAGNKPGLFCGLGLILGGAVGNMIDRVRFRAVVDFLDFYLGQWHWPAFNVADMGICIGAFLACLALWRKSPEQA